MKTSVRVFAALLLLFSLSACWGDKDAEGDNSTNKNTAITLTRPSTFTGKYEIEVFKGIYENVLIDSANLDNFKGEMTISKEAIPTTLEYNVSFLYNNQTVTTGKDFPLTVINTNKLIIDASRITPTPDKVYDFAREGNFYLIVQIDGMTQTGSEEKYDLYIRAEKISDNPEYKED